MLECRFRATHAEAFHDRAGSGIGKCRGCDDFGKFKDLKRNLKCAAPTLGGVTMTPMFRSKPPSDFDTGQEWMRRGWHLKPGEADEFAGFL